MLLLWLIKSCLNINTMILNEIITCKPNQLATCLSFSVVSSMTCAEDNMLVQAFTEPCLAYVNKPT